MAIYIVKVRSVPKIQIVFIVSICCQALGPSGNMQVMFFNFFPFLNKCGSFTFVNE